MCQSEEEIDERERTKASVNGERLCVQQHWSRMSGISFAMVGFISMTYWFLLAKATHDVSGLHWWAPVVAC